MRETAGQRRPVRTVSLLETFEQLNQVKTMAGERQHIIDFQIFSSLMTMRELKNACTDKIVFGGDYELDEYDIFPVQAYYVNDAGSDEVSGLYVH